MQRRIAVLFAVAVALVTTVTIAPAAPSPARSEVLVGFRAGVSEAEQEHVLRSLGARRERRLRRIRAHVVSAPRRNDVLTQLRRDPRVRFAETNRRVHADAPNDARFGELWGLHNVGQAVQFSPGVADADIDALEAWEVTSGTPDVVVAVLDTGVDASHPDLAGRIWTNTGETPGNGVDDDGNGYVDDVHGWDFANGDRDPADDHGHGTHVAGTVAATANNGIGVAGVAPGARVMPLKFLGADGSGTLAGAVDAVLYAADNGADVLNNSWGDTEFSQALHDAMQVAESRGALIVASAGNSLSDNDAVPHYPSNLELPSVLSVAATDNRDDHTWFSNYGVRTVDLSAPGQAVLSTWPGGTYRYLDGTSMAAPHVSGAAALAKAAFPAATGVGLKALLLGQAEPLESLGGLTASGARLNANAAARCDDAPQLWLESPGKTFDVFAGQPIAVRVVATRCAEPGGVTVGATVNGAPLTLAARGDGLFTAAYTPSGNGPLTFVVTAATGGSSRSVTVTGTVSPSWNVTAGGPPVTVTTTSPGQNARVFFAGQSGQRVSLKLSAVTMGTAKVSILGPDGSTLVAPAYMFSTGGFIEPRTLPVAGTYSVLVDPQGTATGSMTLTLYDVPPDAAGSAVPGGSPVSVSVGTPGQNARVTFAATAGRRVSVAVGGVTLPSARVSLTAPDGSTLVLPAYVGPAGGFIDATTVPATGSYSILVDPQGTATGGLTLTLYDVPPDTAAGAVMGGPSVSVSVATPGQNARLTVNGTAGSRLSVKLSGVTLLSTRVSVLSPSGSTLVLPAYVGTAGGFVDATVLPATGVYTVVVDPQGAATGAMTLSVYDVPLDLGASITPAGPAVSVSVSTPGQNARLTFAGTAGTTVSLRIAGVTMTSARVGILAPDGTTLVAPLYTGTAGAFVEPKVLPVSGTYTILVDPQAAATGSMTLTLYLVPPDASATLVAGGPSVTLNLGVPGQNGRVAFDAGAGASLTLRLTGVTISLSKVTVVRPDGSALVGPAYMFAPGRTISFTTAEAGPHAVVVDPQGAVTGSVTLSLA